MTKHSSPQLWKGFPVAHFSSGFPKPGMYHTDTHTQGQTFPPTTTGPGSWTVPMEAHTGHPEVNLPLELSGLPNITWGPTPTCPARAPLTS